MHARLSRLGGEKKKKKKRLGGMGEREGGSWGRRGGWNKLGE